MINDLYKSSLGLLTDLYELTMAYGYWKQNCRDDEAVFHLFFRRRPFQGGFVVAAGLEAVIDFLENFSFSEEDLHYLSGLQGSDGKVLFDQGFIDYLKDLQFSCDLDAVPEGTIVFPYTPLLRIQGPLIQCQILESVLLNLINFPSLIATKAARVSLAAEGDTVFEFGLRRAQGIDGALTGSRAAYLGGCDATSNVLAGKLFDIPPKGTMAHSWVMIFEEELESFQAFAEACPNNCVLLVDTYDSIEGVHHAIQVAKEMEERGQKLMGIRLDSGDLAYLSKEARRLLDKAELQHVKIVASNELDEMVISDLKKQGAKIDVWGVGTNLITAKDHPALDGVYKLSAIRKPSEEWKYRLKLSEQMSKVSNPGILQVRRFYDDRGNIADALYDIHTDLSKGGTIIDPFDATRSKQLGEDTKSYDLLVPIFRKGKCVYEKPALKKIRDQVQKNLKQFHEGIKRFLNPHQYVVGMEKSLYDKKIQLIQKVRKR